jgi:hypothetical protein
LAGTRLHPKRPRTLGFVFVPGTDDGLGLLAGGKEFDGLAQEVADHAVEEHGRALRINIEKAQEAGRRRVRLDTRTSMANAQRLYERLGFVRDPAQDWPPAPGMLLLGYVLEFE